MEQTDLGDRYNNPLKYLITPNLETISDFESPIMTEQSETDPNGVNSELISMLDTLAQTINLEHRRRNNSEVFIPPPGFKDSDLAAKISFIHSLSQSLNNYLATGRFLYSQFSQFYSRRSEEILENPKPKIRKDAISKLINCEEGVYLNQSDLKQLAGMLVGSYRDSAKHQVKELASINRDKLEKKKAEFLQVSENLDALNASQERMIYENSSLRTE